MDQRPKVQGEFITESLRQKDRANFHCAYLNRIFGVIYRRSIAFSDLLAEPPEVRTAPIFIFWRKAL